MPMPPLSQCKRFDVRPLLQRGAEPLPEILKRVQSLEPAEGLLASMSAHLRVLVGQLEDLTLKDVETRLAHWLVKRCPDATSTKPAPIQLSMTKRVLAAELGTV